MTRGVEECVKKFIKELSSKYVPFKVEKDGTAGLKKGNYNTPIGVRPIQLWEIIFPESSKDLILNTIFKGSDGATQHKKHNKFIFPLRKIFGANKIPEYSKEKIMCVYGDHVEKIGIGIKEDRKEDGTEML